MSENTPPKRKVGRPRNTKIEMLQRELACSRRQAYKILKEQSSRAGADGLSPLAHARLDKLLKECSLLEIKIASARLEERQMAGELLHLDEARELVAVPLQAIKNLLANMPKTLAPRLYNQPQKAIEKTLAEFVDAVCREAAAAIEKVKGRKTL